MPRRSPKITQVEMARTLKAAENAEFEIGGYIVNHQSGEMTVFAKGAEPDGGPVEIDKMLGMK